MCSNCNTKPASRRKLCVACYRYHLKHGEPRPLRLIVANRPGPRHHYQQQALADGKQLAVSTAATTTLKPLPLTSLSTKKHCANCGVYETHQWYRNLCGKGHWCETCKSYYLRHSKVRPAELFVKAAKRKVNVRSLVKWATWACDQHEHQHQHQQQHHHQQYDLDSSMAQQQQHEQDQRRLSTCSSLSSTTASTMFPATTHSLYEYDYHTTSTEPSPTSTPSTLSPSSSSTALNISSSWTLSGCRPHLYHPRNVSGSGCNSPNSISAPSTPPPSSTLSIPASQDYTLPSVNLQHKHIVFLLFRHYNARFLLVKITTPLYFIIF
ncbi:hypothetical protein BCR42DRAFT_419619, partial [Absidia repens]